MYFKQFYLGCLAHASYLIGSEGEAIVVDPQRDVEDYLTEAEKLGLKIKYVMETHLHADFVSGHRELAARAGAEIIFGEKAGATFPHKAVKEGDKFTIGKVTLSILETPGHTPESISILVKDESNFEQPMKVLTGDTLFIGDVGRPDLVGAKGYSSEQMAGMLYESLHTKLLTLPDNTEVYPAHGAGSMCGRNISKETSSTIGAQKNFNYALKSMSKEDFVKMMTSDLPEAPAYFSKDAEINRGGAIALNEIPKPQKLSPSEVNKFSQQGYLILDVRTNVAFGTGHVPGAINIGLGGQFASWAGSLLSISTPIIIIAEEEKQIAEAVTRLARVGIESVKGYLAEGMVAWQKAGLEVAQIPQISVADLQEKIKEDLNLQVVDVRRLGEYNDGHIPQAINLTLAKIEKEFSSLDPSRPTAVICQGGYRSSAATGLLANHGFQKLFNVLGGTSAWINAGYETVK